MRLAQDRFGLSWQIVPTVLPELLSDPDPEKPQRVMQAILSMKKLDIEAACARDYQTLRREGATHRTQAYVWWWVTPTVLRNAVAIGTMPTTPAIDGCKYPGFRSYGLFS